MVRFPLFILSSLSLLEVTLSYSSLVPLVPKSSLAPKFRSSKHSSSTTSNTGGTTSSGNLSGQRRKWHRRIIRKVFSKADSEKHTTTTTQIQAVAVHEEPEMASVLRNFDLVTPQSLRPTIRVSSPPPLEEIITALPPEETAEATRHNVGKPLTRVTRKKCESILMDRLDKWSNGKHSGLDVQCDPAGSVLQLLRGHFLTDATITLDRIVFPNIQFSGGKLEIVDFALNLLSFAPDRISLGQTQRYPRAFQFIGTEFVLTQEDLFASKCIRNGLKRLFMRILNNNGIPTLNADIEGIKILSDGKISCVGRATPRFGPPLSFEVRTGLGFKSRGHILTFPGLELSVHRSLGIFVPIPDVSVDLGHNARIGDLSLGAKALTFSIRVNITPDHTLHLKDYKQSSNSYGAQCSVDVGRWLTRLGRFTH